MTSYLAVGEERRINEWNRLQYHTPIIHPSRTRVQFHDLVYMISGSWDVIMDGTVYTFMPGDVFFLPAGSTYEGHSQCSPGTSTYYAHITPSEHDVPAWNDLPDDRIPRVSLPVITHCQNNEHILHLFKEILMLADADSPGREQTLSAMFNTLFYLLSQTSLMDSVRNPKLIDHSLEIMMESSNRFIKESEIAEMNYVSVKTLRSAFMRRFGKTFYQYQMESKLRIACNYLSSQPDKKLRAIAAELGFSDEFHLSKSFKRVYGISPVEYKKRMKTETENHA